MKKTTLRHIIIKLLEIREPEKQLRDGGMCYIQKTKVKDDSRFLTEKNACEKTVSSHL